MTVTTSAEAVWIARARAGDRAAFAALVARYERRIYRFLCRRLGNADDAADLTQETFLKAYCALARTGPDLNVSAWLHRIALNASLDLWRRRRRLGRLPSEPWDGAVREPTWERADDPEERVLGHETQRAVWRALLAMAPRNRQALLLREFEGLSCAEIGAIMGVSARAVKARLYRAREEFRARYLALETSPERTARR